MAEIYRVAPKKPRPIKAPVVGFFGGTTEDSKREAIDWIKERGWTSDDVSLSILDGDYIVTAKRKLW